MIMAVYFIMLIEWYYDDGSIFHNVNNIVIVISVDDSNFHSITLLKRDCSFEELRFRHYTVERQKELKEHDRWLNIMRFICSVESLDLPKLVSCILIQLVN